MEKWNQTLLAANADIRQAMEYLGLSQNHILLVVDENDRLLGTVTDGDIRRSLLDGMALDTPVAKVMNMTPISTTLESSQQERLKLFRTHRILHLPLIDAERRVVGLVGIDELVAAPETQENLVVIMAGGLGTRLRPMTEDTPKPLLPIGGRPILETIIEQLTGHGFTRICLSVNYKSDMVRGHFGDGSKFGAEIQYLEEETRMGTAGPLGLIKEPGDTPILVMNGDLLTKLNFSALLSYHREQQSYATVCVREFDMQIPFGVIEHQNNNVKAIVEKPVHKFLVNAGIYVIESAALAGIPKGQYLDMPDFLHNVIADGQPVVAFPVHEYWLDIGRIEDMSRATSEFTSIFS